MTLLRAIIRYRLRDGVSASEFEEFSEHVARPKIRAVDGVEKFDLFRTSEDKVYIEEVVVRNQDTLATLPEQPSLKDVNKDFSKYALVPEDYSVWILTPLE